MMQNTRCYNTYEHKEWEKGEEAKIDDYDTTNSKDSDEEEDLDGDDHDEEGHDGRREGYEGEDILKRVITAKDEMTKEEADIR